MKAFILTLLLSLGYCMCPAQVVSFDTDTLQWDVVQLTDRNTGAVNPYTCSFITYGDNIVKWVQGDYILDLNVQFDRGSWSDLSQTGSKRYKVTIEGKTGDMIFSREATGLTIKFDFDTADAMPYTFTVQSVQKAN